MPDLSTTDLAARITARLAEECERPPGPELSDEQIAETARILTSGIARASRGRRACLGPERTGTLTITDS